MPGLASYTCQIANNVYTTSHNDSGHMLYRLTMNEALWMLWVLTAKIQPILLRL